MVHNGTIYSMLSCSVTAYFYHLLSYGILSYYSKLNTSPSHHIVVSIVLFSHYGVVVRNSFLRPSYLATHNLCTVFCETDGNHLCQLISVKRRSNSNMIQHQTSKPMRELKNCFEIGAKLNSFQWEIYQVRCSWVSCCLGCLHNRLHLQYHRDREPIIFWCQNSENQMHVIQANSFRTHRGPSEYNWRVSFCWLQKGFSGFLSFVRTLRTFNLRSTSRPEKHCSEKQWTWGKCCEYEFWRLANFHIGPNISLVPHCFRVHLGWICKTATSFIHGPVLMQVPVAGATSTTQYARGFCCQYICLTAWLSCTRGLGVGLLFYGLFLGKDFQKTQVWILGDCKL